MRVAHPQANTVRMAPSNYLSGNYPYGPANGMTRSSPAVSKF